MSRFLIAISPLLRLLLVMEPLWAKFSRNFVFFRVAQRINLVEVREYVTLNDCRGESLMSLLSLAYRLLEVSIAHVSVICLKESALLGLLHHLSCRLVAYLIQSED